MTVPFLDRPRLERLIRGASVLGTGGGGSYSVARALVDDLDRRALRPRLLDPAALPTDAFGVSTVVLGGGLSHEQLEALPMIADRPASLRAARALAAHVGRSIDFVFPIELGPQNTMEAVRLAALLDVPLLDADAAGRAVPEMHQTTVSAHGIALAPFAIATFQGDLAVIAETGSEARNEALCRALAIASGGVICVAGFALSGRQASAILIPQTLSRCIALGELIGAGRQPAAQLAEQLGGRIAFEGRVREQPIDTAGGFFRGMLELDGSDRFAGERYRIGIQNEFMWAWRGDRLDARCPDLICVVQRDSGIGKVTYGHGFENAIEPGEWLSVLHVPAPEVWSSGRLPDPFPPPPPLPPA